MEFIETEIHPENDFLKFESPVQHKILKTLEKYGPLTRRDLVKKLDTPRTTIYDNLLKLQDKKLVVKFSRNNGKRGRPLIFWKKTDGEEK